jgi:hypothetical protein
MKFRYHRLAKLVLAHHATLAFHRCRTQKLALCRQVIGMVPETIRWKVPVFDNAIRIEETFFESLDQALT